MRVRASMVAAICAVVLASGVALATPAPVRAREACPAAPVTLGEIMDLYLPRGPLATRYPPAVAWINEAGRACLGRSTLVFRAFVNGTGGIGGPSKYSIAPGWFLERRLIVFATDHEAHRGVGAGAFYGIAVPPGFGDLQARYHRRWVTITAHFRDSRATRCRASGVLAGATPTRRQAIRICESILVLSAIRPASAPPDTATGPEGGPGGGPPWTVLALGAATGAWLGSRRSRRLPG